jgi:recombination protein RecT
MTENALIAIEQQLRPLAPRFAEVLGNLMPVERLIRTVLVSVERTPRLLECNRQSLFNAAMSAACLGLEVDGVTGQAFLIPFKDRAQLLVGYKGFNTLGARSGLTITGAVVREDDAFEYELGDRAFVRHRPKLGGKGRIIAAWATATALDRPPVISVLSIDDILAIKARSPAARKEDSPWNDPHIGFPAMAEKSAKRRLARSLPLNVMQLAARLDEAVEEQGRHAFITPERGLQIEGEVMPPPEPSPTPTAQQLIAPAAPLPTYEPEEYIRDWDERVQAARTREDGIELLQRWNSQLEKDIRRATFGGPDPRLRALTMRVSNRIAELKQKATV